jgi:hypothetical protein
MTSRRSVVPQDSSDLEMIQDLAIARALLKRPRGLRRGRMQGGTRRLKPMMQPPLVPRAPSTCSPKGVAREVASIEKEPPHAGLNAAAPPSVPTAATGYRADASSSTRAKEVMAGRSCPECRLRKVRCDNVRPWSRCIMNKQTKTCVAQMKKPDASMSGHAGPGEPSIRKINAEFSRIDSCATKDSGFSRWSR